MKKDLSNQRQQYDFSCLTESKTPQHPFELFNHWYDEVVTQGGVDEANAMILSTAQANGRVNSRVVLLKQVTNTGFVFYTNYNSQKGIDIEYNKQVSICFYWQNLARQIIVQGKAHKVPSEDSDRYFASRPEGSQLGAHVSEQSKEIASKEVLYEKLQALTHRFKGKTVPRPKHWGGYEVIPSKIEFWQGQPNRLHDRIVYYSNENQWVKKRLSP